jgi:hypothetical protein
VYVYRCDETSADRKQGWLGMSRRPMVQRVARGPMLRPRNTVVVVVVVLILAACEPVSAPVTTNPTTTTIGPLPPPDLDSPPPAPTTPPVMMELPGIDYRGVLPDGTTYAARIPGLREESLTLITGTFNMMDGDELVPVGEVRYVRVGDSPGDLGYVDGVLRLWNRPWLVEVLFEPATSPDLDKPPFGAGIEMTLRGGFPVLDLSEPFTWTGSDPQIRYESFVVAPGCWSEAAHCADNHAVQVLSGGDVFVGGGHLNDFQAEAMTLTTTSERSPDPDYLDTEDDAP